MKNSILKASCWSVLTILMGFYSSISLGQQVSDAFNVTVYDSFVRVIAPNDFHKDQSVVIENRTMTRIKGKVESGNGAVLAFIAIEPGKFQAIEAEVKEDDEIFFVPLSPGLPEAELIIGRKSYEVPPQDKN